jgi:hypothetical protein
LIDALLHRRYRRRADVKRAGVLAAAFALVSMWVVLAAGLTPVWLTDDARVVSLEIVSAVIVVWLLVSYFDWRGRLVRHIRAAHDAHERLGNAA